MAAEPLVEQMQKTSNGFRVEIPPKRRKLAVIVVLGVAIFTGAVGVSFLNRAAASIQSLFPIGVCVLTIAVSVFTLIGELFGKEGIELDGCMLIVTEIIFGFKITRRFDITLVKNLTVGAANYWQGTTYVMSNGGVHFEYRERMVSIGGTVDEDEAFAIVDGIRKQITPEKIGT
jgi:hypothetical protein